MTRWLLTAGLALALLPGRAAAQRIDVDVSACRRMYDVMTAMKAGAPRAAVEARLDSVLASPAYQVMFRHYDRPWRPRHLPPDVFKRMILSLGYPDAYTVGENARADRMRTLWARTYARLDLYERDLRDLEATDLRALLADGVAFARGWLPPDWPIPDFTVDLHPDGGSNAFAIDGAQGYDFLQLPRDPAGRIRWADLRVTVSHESHHLGIATALPAGLTPADSVAFAFLALFTGEGTASKFINDYPGGCVPAVDPARRDVAFDTSEVGRWWTRYTADEPRLFARLVDTFERARAGRLSADSLNAEIASFWLAGYISPVYFVGSELYGAVVLSAGKRGAFAAMRDPRQLFRLYDQALRAPGSRFGGCVAIPDSTVAHALAIGGRARGTDGR